MASINDDSSHHNIPDCKFSSRTLGTSESLPPSVPLVLPNNVQYNEKSCKIVQSSPEQTSSKPGLNIVPSSINLIKSLGRKPLAVLSICGPYRSGKSYFLSRFLGSKEIFKISNTDDPCTQGIWMSTSVLECDEYAILLLDTEGMESLEASEEYIVKLLVITTTISSTLIYNSIGIPERSDLESLSQLSNVTSSIIVKSGTESDNLYKHFPQFLWLVRDATLTCAGTPTEYIRNEVLVRSSKPNPDKLDCIVHAITSVFPSVECCMLPCPSIDLDCLADMLSNESQLNVEFLKELTSVYEHLLSHIRPKGIDGPTTTIPFSGIIIAELLEQYVHAVNTDQDIVIQTCWQSAFKSALYSYSNQLVAKYQQQMKASLNGKLPMEQGYLSTSESQCDQSETLMLIHCRIVHSLYEDFCQEVQIILATQDSNSAQDVTQEFLNRIAIYDTENCQVEGGELLNFVNQNYTESSRLCYSIFDECYSPTHQCIMEAHKGKKQIDISADVETIKTEYNKRAIGPAKDEVLKVGLIKLQMHCDSLTEIPGPPEHLKATKIAKDHIVIRWNGAAFNNHKVTRYTAEYTEAQATEVVWKTIEVDECTATAKELNPHTKYIFRVHAYINENKSHESTVSITTKVSSIARGAATFGVFLGGAIVSPVAAVSISPPLAPVMSVAGMLTAPVTGCYFAKKVFQKTGEENIPYMWKPL